MQKYHQTAGFSKAQVNEVTMESRLEEVFSNRTYKESMFILVREEPRGSKTSFYR